VLVRTADGTIIARLPDGRTLRPAPPLRPGRRPVAAVTTVTDHAHPEAIIPTWGGEPLRLADSLHAGAYARRDGAA
jgi:hypothetical protein